MMDLKNGILDVNGVEVTKNSKIEDFAKLPEGIVNISMSKRGSVFVRFIQPIIANGVKMMVTVSFFKNEIYPEIELFPEIRGTTSEDELEGCKAALAATKKWLSAIITEKPLSISSSTVHYKFKGIDLYSSISPDRDYGYRFNPLEIEFIED